ncbi:MAG: alpha/beta fold hydrolase [Acidobacteriota bacterium]|nr:alpha/beta fold hydrolase [Acidobacteriota bacterium]
MILHSGEVDLFYEVCGKGPDVVLLHPYPCDHTFWLPVVPFLESRFRLILPDLRGLGQSGLAHPENGEPVTTMAQLATDALALCDALGIGRTAFAGCSVGGYALFELWRRARERVKALAFFDTRAGADGEEGIQGRLQAAADVLERGPEWAIGQMMPRMVSAYTLGARPDVVEMARNTMRRATAPGMAALQRGMASRADSLATLSSITVPSLVLGGEDDLPSPVAELERIARGIPGAELKIVSRAGHTAALEHPEEAGPVLRDFLERHAR